MNDQMRLTVLAVAAALIYGFAASADMQSQGDELTQVESAPVQHEVSLLDQQ